MAPKRKILRKEMSLDQFDDGMTEQLRQLLRAFDCETNLSVRILTHKDGKILAKYEVSIKLPEKLGLMPLLPTGEARNRTAAYHVAVVEAVTAIRERKAKFLVGTSFTSIPHDTIDRELKLDHLTLVKNNPVLASKYLDRYRDLVGSLYHTHQLLVEDQMATLEDFTHPQKRQELWEKLDKEASGSHTTVVADSHRKSPAPKQSRYSPTPEPIHYPVISASYEAPQSSWGISDTELLIENSTGWRFGSDDDSEVGQTSQPRGQTFATDGNGTEIVDLETEEEEPMERLEEPIVTQEYQVANDDTFVYYTQEQARIHRETYLGLSGLSLSDTSVTETSGSVMNTSDTDYVPTGRPYVPETVRRTPRQHGWFPGMFCEPW